MPDYGVLPEGVNIMRLDEILGELHADATDGWGVNTQQNPKSYLNVLFTAVADIAASLWEFGLEVYNSSYPSTAEGISLDYSAQLGGALRTDAQKSFYRIHCEAVDGTAIPANAVIASTTNPVVQLYAADNLVVGGHAFNKADIKLVSVAANSLYSLSLDGDVYAYTSSAAPTEGEILAGVRDAITSPFFTASVAGNILRVEAVDIRTSHSLALGDKLTTSTVTSLVTFASGEPGDVYVPDGVMTNIVTLVPGLIAVNNIAGYIPGRLQETDAEFRETYADKIFGRSLTMIESVKAAIIRDVQGVTAIAVEQNDTDLVDSMGRYPHSIEVVVDGGDDYLIAQAIFQSKSAGINTFGDVEISIIGDGGEPIIVRFNRSEYLYVWLQLEVTQRKDTALAAGYSDAIKELLVNQFAAIPPGTEISLQELLGQVYAEVPGVAYVDISAWVTTSPSASTGVFDMKTIEPLPRQRAVTTLTRIEVLLVA